ncbi:fumarylacetoacetate hydrolase family protein [Candidatus Poriferisodalis sp.]|uniref:fumarylacetoacetate hydrolase family protein n=1 Tax=Candidatus Poriferisodalis sp. TaxID=3101277 RepID=UPI003B58DDF9
MKLGTASVDGLARVVAAGSDGKARLFETVCRAAGVEAPPTSLLELIENGPRGDELAALQPAIDSVARLDGPLDWLPPVSRPSKILGVAFNNVELMRKAHVDPGVPNFFLKAPSAMQGHGKPIEIDPAWGAVIPEPEICAVIGSRARDISEECALDYVFGFAIHNDVTSHGLKFGLDSVAISYEPDLARAEFYRWRNLHGPDDRDAYYVYHARSKGTDTFGPIGPWVTTADQILDPNDVTITADLDGEVFTVDHTSNYRFSVQACIAEASRYFTLEPGDIISFGTTGKGQGRFPRGHKSVLMGEVVGTIGIAIDGLGRLENPIDHIDTGVDIASGRS